MSALDSKLWGKKEEQKWEMADKSPALQSQVPLKKKADTMAAFFNMLVSWKGERRDKQLGCWDKLVA